MARKSSPIVDTGTPPASITKRKELEAKILADGGDDSILEGNEPVVYGSGVIADVPVEVNLERVKLEHQVYTVQFGVLDVSISDHQVAIKIPNSSSFKFEPKVDSKFVIHYRGRSYRAVYLGGIFNFDSDSSWAITFILEGNSKADGEE
jgi:hypothetical protein